MAFQNMGRLNSAIKVLRAESLDAGGAVTIANLATAMGLSTSVALEACRAAVRAGWASTPDAEASFTWDRS